MEIQIRYICPRCKASDETYEVEWSHGRTTTEVVKLKCPGCKAGWVYEWVPINLPVEQVLEDLKNKRPAQEQL